MPNIVTVNYHATNYYVIETDNARLLVDAGWPGTLPAFLHAFHRKGVDPSALTHILVTHYHPDHAGLVQELKGRGARLIVLENQLAAIPALERYMKPQDSYLAITRDNNVHIHSHESRSYLHGLGIEGSIILTPGHSDDSISLVLDTGIAFTGDLPAVAVSDNPTHPAHQSIARLRALNVHTLYPAHGPARPLAQER